MTKLMLTIALTAPAFAAPASVQACEFQEITWYNPTGWVGCERYGDGIASTWPGPGVAVNSCVYPWTDCAPITVTSLDTGRSVIAVPQMFCGCYVNGVGPQGETERIVDLDPATLAALGLAGPGLYPVSVEPIGSVPDTAMEVTR